MFNRWKSKTVVTRHDSVEWTKEDAVNARSFLSSPTGKKLVALIEDNAFARFMNGKASREEINGVLSVIPYMNNLAPEGIENNGQSGAADKKEKTTTIQRPIY